MPPSVDSFLPQMSGVDVSGTTEVVRAYLARAHDHLSDMHRSGASGRETNQTHSDLMDRLVRRLFELAEERYFAGGGEQAGLCVVAVGGYARREMSLHSDVDLLFLYRDRLSPHVQAVVERMQMWLWDAQLAVGAATRTIAETLKLARRDMTVRTAVLAPRFLTGSGVLFHEFQEQIRGHLCADPLQFIHEQLRTQQERHARFGDSLYLLQPNVKEGAGGLRDYHVATWVMQVSQPGSRGREDLLHLGLLTEGEFAEYGQALDFLWRLRNGLHLHAGRKQDQLSFDVQEKLAESEGYGSVREDANELPVERFMSDYYRHARAIQNYSSLAVEQCQQRVSMPRRRKVRSVEGGFRLVGGQLEIPHPRQLREDPVRLLLAIAVAQDHDVVLTRKARRMLREHLWLVDEVFRRNPRAQEVFFRILRSERRVTTSLTTMNEVGLLGAFLPEWAHVVCRWQHVMYHTYTIDVHSIFLVEELRRLWLGDHETDRPELTEMVRSADDRVVLFLGCLLHDIGKGFGAGDHSGKGVERARPCVERLGLSAERQERVLFLVQYHLLMSHLAQRRDLSDPKLILEFARICGDRTNLRNLYLLTYADMRASSKKAWTDWKGRLLSELFERTSELLETGSADPGKAIELIEARVETRRDAAAAELRRVGFDESDIATYFDVMPRRYFTAHAPSQIARHAQVLLGLGRDELMATAIRELRGGFSEFILCTRDVHGLYANVAGTLTAHDFNILAAHVYTTRTGLALESYRVATPPGGEDERRLAWDELRRSLEAVLRGEKDVRQMLGKRRLRVGGPRQLSPRDPVVSITNEESDFYTIVDVTADDRLGLLHDLTRTIADHGYEIYISKAARITDQVSDTFYLKDREGKKLHDPDAIGRLRDDLHVAAQVPEESGGG